MTLAERIGAYISLVMLVGLVAFLVIVEIPIANKDVIMLITGAITTAAATGISKLSGGGKDEKYEKLKGDYESLKSKFDALETKYIELNEQYARLTDRLIKDHVIKDAMDEKTKN